MNTTSETQRRFSTSMQAARSTVVLLVAMVVSLLASLVPGPGGAQPASALSGFESGASIVVSPDSGGYAVIGTRGGQFNFGSSRFSGSLAGVTLSAPVVDAAAQPDTHGKWFVASDGGVFALGAPYFGSMAGKPLNKPIVGIAPTPSGRGYWLVAGDGGVFSFGDAGYFGSMGGKGITNVVGIAATATGNGYWLVGSDGGVFSFGDAAFYGSMGGQPINKPIVEIVRTTTGRGYSLVAADGGTFNFGDAPYPGSLAGVQLNAPIVDAIRPATGPGLWLVASDGGVFALGAPYHGSAAGIGNTPASASGKYAFILPANKVNRAWLIKPHHDYPASDIPVPAGTPYFAVTSGRITHTSNGGSCGLGLILAGDDGVRYTYCHGSSRGVPNGTRVAAGAPIGLTGNTGTSTGAHLHLQINYPSKIKRCPQTFLVALYEGRVSPDPRTLPTSGCSN